jgi:hypothetical protein
MDCADMLDHYYGQHIPSSVQEAASKVQRAIGHLARLLNR